MPTMTTAPVATLAIALLFAAPALAKDCTEAGAKLSASERRACAEGPMRELKPYDPRDQRRSEPGVIDLGNGTTVRVRGAVSMEADVARR